MNVKKDAIAEHGDLLKSMREEFRAHLQRFYSGLHLAAPYDSVEKALAQLTRSLKTLPVEARAKLAGRPDARFRHYTTAFAESGLAEKHRGIIAGLVKSGQVDLPADYRPWLELFGQDRSRPP